MILYINIKTKSYLVYNYYNSPNNLYFRINIENLISKEIFQYTLISKNLHIIDFKEITNEKNIIPLDFKIKKQPLKYIIFLIKKITKEFF